MRLLLMRHAKSSWKDSTLSDHDRPLNKRGKNDAPKMGNFMKYNDLAPELIICSTAKRAKDTAASVIEYSGFDGAIAYDEFLYHADIEQFINSIIKNKGEYKSIMMIGHNPGLEMLVEDLIGDYHRMPTGAIAVVEMDIADWGDLLDDEIESKLVNVYRPKEI